MKKLILFILIVFTCLLLSNSSIVINTTIHSSKLFIFNIFPSLFAFFIISDLLINFGFIEISSKLFKPLMKLFKIDYNCSYIFVLSMISGFPSNSKYTKDLYLKKIISLEDSIKVLLFTHFSNPLFILGTISINYLNKRIGLFILLVHYLTNIIIGFIFRNIINSNSNNNKIETSPTTFTMCLKNSIISAFNALFLIFGLIIVFSIIINITNKYIGLNPLLKGIINGILEMTSGINSISNLNISLRLKTTLITMFLSFGGLCIHMQVRSILIDTPIKYYPYLISRILHCSISGIIIYYLFPYI